MDPQIDTAQRRAEAIGLVAYMFGVPEYEIATGEYENAIQEVLKMQAQIRRDVLTEAITVAKKHRDTGDLYTSGNRIVVALDRLREGV